MDCLFCKIISGEADSEKIYEDDNVFAFKDIFPQAPIHILVIHKSHTKDIDATTRDNSKIFADIFFAVKEIARLKELTEKGYRTIINNGRDAGQVVWHLHVHLLAGKPLGPMLQR